MASADGEGGRRLIASVRALEQVTGVRLNDGHKLEVGEDGRIAYQADNVVTDGSSDLAAWRRAFWADGGLEDQIADYNRSLRQDERRAENLRAQIRSLGAIPAFARGGTHRGGLARVGEDDIELVAPSRIYNPAETKSVLDNQPLAKGLEDLTRHVVAQGQVMRMILDRIANQIDDWDEGGLPEVRS